mmetsp:Transcript_5041/g.18147  ORF Transcript_5041/g.18147 Transcript_5041/m.18147 type:complete len:375 (-) Transcript_5041:37-1161(-)
MANEHRDSHDISMHQYVRRRDEGMVESNHLLQEAISRRIPHVLRERELSGVDRCNKIFSSIWLDANRVLAGTKDNQLMIWDVKDDTCFCLPSYMTDDLGINNCGIHSIAMSDDRVIATGGQKPEDIMIIQGSNLRPSKLLRGHTDWVFALEWIDTELLVSCSRDKSVMLWRPNQPGKKPVDVRLYHLDKVRDLKSARMTSLFATLSIDGTVKFWDVMSNPPLSTVHLRHTQDLVCMAFHQKQGLFLVGSESHVQILDPRTAKLVETVEALETGRGVRSLSVLEDVLTVGSGAGSLSFLDLRIMKYMELENAGGRNFYRTGRGWLKRDSIFDNYFLGQEAPNAVYTHCYDPTRTKLFVGGGPLAFGLSGSYAAIW